MEEIVYEPSLPFVVQTGVPEYSAGSTKPVLVEWEFHSRYVTYNQAVREAEVIGEDNEFVRVVKVT